MITQKELFKHIHYCPNSGIFTRLVHTNNRTKNKPCGSVQKYGHIRIIIDGKAYLAHRLAWLYMTGEMPKGLIDHKDCNPSNNKWDNLRIANNAQNSFNRSIGKTNSSGVKGVCWNKSLNKWQAGIKINYKSYHLGLFDNIEDAKNAVERKRKEHHGEFANNG